MFGLFRRWRSRSGPTPFMMVERGRSLFRPNPLPLYFPALYREPPADSFAHREAILKDADALSRDLVHACRLPLVVLPEALAHNFGLLLEIPAVYTLLLHLRGKRLDALYRSTLALAALLQITAFEADSRYTQELHQELPLWLLAVTLRFYGIHFLPEAALRVLRDERPYDISAPGEQRQRDQFLALYRKQADEISRLSVSRLHVQLKDGLRCPRDPYLGFLHIVRFSARLMGRTASEPGTEQPLHKLAGYIAVLSCAAAAWSRHGKRLSVILAEEWTRNRTFHRHNPRSASVRFNTVALEDLMQVCRCAILPDHYGEGCDALYSGPEKVILAPEPVAEKRTQWSSADPLRRFLDHARLAALEGAAPAAPPRVQIAARKPDDPVRSGSIARREREIAMRFHMSRWRDRALGEAREKARRVRRLSRFRAGLFAAGLALVVAPLLYRWIDWGGMGGVRDIPPLPVFACIPLTAADLDRPVVCVACGEAVPYRQFRSVFSDRRIGICPKCHNRINMMPLFRELLAASLAARQEAILAKRHPGAAAKSQALPAALLVAPPPAAPLSAEASPADGAPPLSSPLPASPAPEDASPPPVPAATPEPEPAEPVEIAETETPAPQTEVRKKIPPPEDRRLPPPHLRTVISPEAYERMEAERKKKR